MTRFFQHALTLLILISFGWRSHGQDSVSVNATRLKIVNPMDQVQAVVQPGDTVRLLLTASGGSDDDYYFSAVLSKPGQLPTSRASAIYPHVALNASGEFTWIIPENLVPSAQASATVTILFKVANKSLEEDSVLVPVTIFPGATKSMRLSPEVDDADLQIRVMAKAGWNLITEGDTVKAKLETWSDGKHVRRGVRWSFEGGDDSGILVDSAGSISWIPDFDFVDRLQLTREIHVVFLAEDDYGNSATHKVVFTVFHANRGPEIRNLPVFYVVQGSVNTIQLTSLKNRIFDPDGDPFVFISVPSKMPQGATLSSTGVLSWKPSRSQFNQLKLNPVLIEFLVEDQPAKVRSSGRLRVEVSQMDLPPEITMIPGDSIYQLDEDEFLNINFYLSDPNGDEDVATFDFIADNPMIGEEVLRKNTETQYEFIWEPGFDFVQDPEASEEVNIRFFAFDQARNATERMIHVTVKDTRNLAKLDEENDLRYKDILVRTLDLMDQLDENQKVLEKELRKAKRGRKNRALISATFGAITGLSPIVLQNDPQKIVSAVGGTTVVTMGTLEARDALGQSADEVGTQIKINVDLRNKLQNEGDGFARRYKTKSSRRNESFSFDIDKLKSILNDSQLVKLQLDGNWENPKEIDNRRLRQVFTDYRSPQNSGSQD